MKLFFKQCFMLVSLLFGLSLTAKATVIWEAHPDTEVHQYAVVYFSGSWEEAAAEAASLGVGWHLATITNQAEQDFLLSTLYSDAMDGKYWLGGIQEAGASAPDTDWTWVTGETWDYTNWFIGQPDDWQNTVERYLQTAANLMGWQWNDTIVDPGTVGFIMERSGDSVYVSEPGSLGLLGLGLAALGLFSRRFQQHKTPPSDINLA